MIVTISSKYSAGAVIFKPLSASKVRRRCSDCNTVGSISKDLSGSRFPITWSICALTSSRQRQRIHELVNVYMAHCCGGVENGFQVDSFDLGNVQGALNSVSCFVESAVSQVRWTFDV